MTTLVNLRQIRANAAAIRMSTGVGLIGVVKANAYGLGAVAVADAISDLVAAWYVFSADEATKFRLWDVTSKPTLCAIVKDGDPIESLRKQHVRPGVWTLEQVQRWRSLDPILSVDTGMQRFACPTNELDVLMRAHRFTEAYTHASQPGQAHELRSCLGSSGMKLHAAGSALLDDPTCWLDAVRPGLALYENAVRVSLPLADARVSRGPIGYTGFRAGHHGVILKGYSQGMRPGICRINGRPQQIIEVGMQSAFVTLDPKDKAGDEVMLLCEELSLAQASEGAKSSPHETLVRIASMGELAYEK